jgi:purine-binding chemotaxis protein CheW
VVSQGPAAIGILFDAVGEILRLHANDVVPVTARCPGTEVRPSPVKAILTRNGGERVIQILDLSLLLSIRNLPLLERRSKQRLADKDFLTRRMRDLKREKMIGFNIGDFDLAFEMKCVLAILDNKGTRPSPRKSELCESVILFGKKVVPVVPLAHVLSIPRDAVSKRIIVCQVGESFIGFEVSEVTTIMPFSPERVLPIPVLSEHRSSVIKGCFKREDGTDFIVLNHEATLSNPEIVDISVGHQQIGNERQLSEETSGGPRVSLLTFRLGKLFGIRLLDVTEVLIAPKTLVRTPSMPPAVLGVLNLRGEPVSVIDPRQLLQLDPAPAETVASVLVFRHERRKVAMLVDSIESIVSVPAGPELELPEIFFREEQAKLMDSFERGLHVETDGVKSVLLLLSAEQIVRLLLEALK